MLPPVLWPNFTLCQSTKGPLRHEDATEKGRCHQVLLVLYLWLQLPVSSTQEETLCFLFRAKGSWGPALMLKETMEYGLCLPVATTGEFVAKVARFTNAYPREQKEWLYTYRQKIKTRVKGKKLNVWNSFLKSSWGIVEYIPEIPSKLIS